MKPRSLPSLVLAVLALGAVATSAVAQSPEVDPISIDRLLSLGPAVGGETPIWSPDGERILFSSGLSGGLVTIPAEGGHPRPVPIGLGGAGHFLSSQTPRWSPDGSWVSYISDKGGSPELWLWSVETGEERQLTTTAGRLINSYRWAPDGSAIALATDRYGDMDVWKVSVPDGELTRLTSDETYEVYPSWTPDSRRILFVRLDSTWTEHTVLEMPADGGDARTVVRDADFFDYHAGESFGYPRVSPDGGTVLFRSHRSGWINYWAVPRKGGEPRRLAPQDADQSHARWSPDGSRVVFVTNRDGTRSLTLVDLEEGDARTLVAPEGMGVIDHPEWSPDGERVSYTLATPTRPRGLHVVDLSNGRTRQLVDSNPLGGLPDRLVAPEKVRYESTDGHTIHAYLYAPPNRSADRAYPGVLWIHGGPTSQYADTFEQHVQYFVQRGYVVLLPNIRGSSGYGKAFEDANNGCWSHCDLEDVRRGVDYLKTLPYVDEGSMGITGTSYGGIMTMAASAFAPGLFQAAVAQSGYGDWVAFMEQDNELRHRKLLEYELGPYPESEDVYRHVSAIRAVEDVRTPLFLVHGVGRYPGSPQSLQFAGALQEQYKVFRYKTYPGEAYYVYGRENRRQLLRDIEAFFDVYLRGEARELPGRSHITDDGS